MAELQGILSGLDLDQDFSPVIPRGLEQKRGGRGKRVLRPIERKQRVSKKGKSYQSGAAYRGLSGKYAKSPPRMSQQAARDLFTFDWGIDRQAKAKAIAGAKRSRRILYGKIGRVSPMAIAQTNAMAKRLPLVEKRKATWGKGTKFHELWPWQRRTLSPSSLKNRKKLSGLAAVQLYGQKRKIKSPAGCAAALRVGQIVNRAKYHGEHKRAFAQSPRKQAALLKAAMARGNQKAFNKLVSKYPQGAALLGGGGRYRTM